jgi:hypothetical protein
VFDNATDPAGLRAFLPSTGATLVVITSTEQAFAELAEPVTVDKFTRAESLGYLRARTGLADEDGADMVAEELGDLPLAVAQAAATIRRRHWSYAHYLDEVHQLPLDELLAHTPGADYPRSTVGTLLLSVTAVEDSDPSALTGLLLRVVAMLSPDGVPRDLLNGLSTTGDRREIDTAVERCAAGSLLTWSLTEDSVIMHRLLGRALRERDKRLGQSTISIAAALDLLAPRLFDKREAWLRRVEGAQPCRADRGAAEVSWGSWGSWRRS